MTVLPADPRGNFASHRQAILEAVTRVLDGGYYVLGPEVTTFEAEFAAYLGAGQAIGVASGTDALQLALRTLGIGPGDSVLTVSHTAVATVAAVEMTGAQAVLLDVDDERMGMTAEGLSAAIEALKPQHGFRAVIPVHLYGQPVDIEAIVEVAHRQGLFVVEDCAQAHGAEVNGRKVGTFGDIGAFSFYPTKNLGALGDAGALVTGDVALAERARALREYGWRQRYISDLPGINSRLDPVQAAVLRVKLPYLDAENERRRRIAARYNEALRESDFLLPNEAPGTRHVYHQYVLRSEHREELRSFLADRGIGTLVHYPQPVHLQPAYAGRVHVAAGGLPVTERLATQVLSLPVQPELTDDEVQTVIDALLAFRL